MKKCSLNSIQNIIKLKEQKTGEEKTSAFSYLAVLWKHESSDMPKRIPKLFSEICIQFQCLSWGFLMSMLKLLMRVIGAGGLCF